MAAAWVGFGRRDSAPPPGPVRSALPALEDPALRGARAAGKQKTWERTERRRTRAPRAGAPPRTLGRGASPTPAPRRGEANVGYNVRAWREGRVPRQSVPSGQPQLHPPRDRRRWRRKGSSVERFSIRGRPATLVDPADLAEANARACCWQAGAVPLLAALAAARAPRALRRLARACCAPPSARAPLRPRRRCATSSTWPRPVCCVALAASVGRRPPPARAFRHQLGGGGDARAHAGRAAVQLHRARSRGVRSSAGAVARREDRARRRRRRRSASSGAASCIAGRPATDWDKVHVVRCGVDAPFLAAGPQPIADSRASGVRRPAGARRRGRC